MRDVYIASHGHYAQGIVSGLDLLIGDDHNVTPICAYCDGGPGSTAELAQHLEDIARETARRGNELVLFTDMQGGSVNNTAVQLMTRYPHMHVVSGANLIMLMEFCLSEHPDCATRIHNAIAMACDAMQYMNTLPEIRQARAASFSTHQDDKDDFFSAGEWS